jgi:cytochrome b
VVRIIHLILIAAFTLNYFLLESGGDLHQLTGYVALCAVLIRIVWAFLSQGYSNFKHIKLHSKSFSLHFSHLKDRNIPSDSGHNPVGWLMVLATWLVFIGLATTGFMLEEVDHFFGSSLIEDIHSLLSNILYLIIIVHIIAVLFVSWWGKISLVAPMITGKRRL